MDAGDDIGQRYLPPLRSLYTGMKVKEDPNKEGKSESTPPWWCWAIPWTCPVIQWGILPPVVQKFIDELVDFLEYCLECMGEDVKYIYALLKYKISDSGMLPVVPGAACLILGFFTLGAILMGTGAVFYFFGQPLFSAVEWLFGSAFSFFGSFSSYFLSFASSLSYLARNAFGFLYEACQSLAAVTYSDPRVWVLVMLTALFWGALEVYIDFMEGETKFEGTKFYDVWKILDYPFAWILSEIDDFFGEGIIYWLAKVMVLPFEAGAFVLSLLVGLLCSVLEELFDHLKNKN